MAAATVPTPSATIGGQNYYTGQAFNYGGQAYTPVYDQSGKRVGYRNQAGAMVAPTPVLDGLSAPTITPTGPVTAAQAAAANQGSSTSSSFGVNPTITTGGAQTGATQGEQPPDINYARAYLRQMGGAGLTDTSFDAGVSDAQVMDFWNKQHPAPAQAATSTAPTIQPEQVALGNMAQIDPTSEALRQNLGQSYLSSLGPAPVNAPPTAANVQSYLDLYKQVDPTGAAGRQQLESALTSQAALGTQLDPETIREITQATRQAQQARGNVYGTPQLVQEAMTRGQAGMAIQQQRQQALQSYLGSGQSMGDVAMNLYQQGQANYQQQLANYRGAQSGALGYLGSGQTPYQAGAGYVDRAEAAAANAAQGGASYNPSQIGQSYQGAQLPQYGLDIGAQATNWYNSMVGQSANQAAYGQTGSNKLASAGVGAATGALSGAVTGLAAGGVGAIPGAIVGALGGAAKGYFS
jgi:hypothetical protein